ncbi:hypothetical protein FRC07_011011 [Ceratobasidium sp. 392]|nr:hypothetical protein FRC07_011011 [Ceratobasidium sp. 392]
MYAGLFNSSYVPTPYELDFIYDPFNLLGPLYFSVVFSLLLNGIILAQTFNYTEQSIKDPLLLRLLVYVSSLLCIAKSADTLSFTWRIFVEQFGDYWAVAYEWTPDQNITVAASYFMALLVQSYFIWRSFKLSRNWYFLVITSLTALSGPIASAVLIAMGPNSDGYDIQPYQAISNVMIIGTFLADAEITGFTCWYFFKQGRRSPFDGTKDLIARLIKTTMQSAVLPLICSILNLAFNFRFLESDGTWVFLFDMLTPYLYVISLLFTLNSRSKLRTVTTSHDGEAGVYGPPSSNSKPATHYLWPDQSGHRATEVHVSITKQSQVN